MECDGKQPCGRCAFQKSVDCVYEVPIRQSKEHMRSEIEQLRTQNKQSERVLAALVSEGRSEEVLEQLRSGETLEEVSASLDRGEGKDAGMGPDDKATTTYTRSSDHKAIGSVLKTAKSAVSSPLSTLALSEKYGNISPAQDPGSWPRMEGGTGTSNSNQSQHDDTMRWSSEDPNASSQHSLDLPLVGTWHQQIEGEVYPDSTVQSMRDQGRGTILGQEFSFKEHPGHNYTASWTEVTSDDELVEHLMALYFCWEYPTFASLSKEHFLDDYRMGNPRHCSSLLVNAMLAVGCRFSTQEATRTVSADSNTAGDHFFSEAVRLLALEEDRHRITTVQALGLLSIREASCGRSSEGIYYSGQSIRLAIEMGLHMESKSGGGDNASLEHAVRSATFWGAFSLDQYVFLSVADTSLVVEAQV